MRNLFLFLSLLVFASCQTVQDETVRAAQVQALFKKDLHEMNLALDRLYQAVQPAEGKLNTMQTAFKEARLHYKAAEYLAEYLYPMVAEKLNGPALQKIEVEPDEITSLKPNGFQVVEEILFSGEPIAHQSELINEVAYLKKLGEELAKNEAVSQLKDRQVFEAMRYQVVRILSLGVSGFDSPVSQQSIPEAIASLNRMKSALQPYGNPSVLNQKIEATLAFLKKPATSFETLDRLALIRDYLTPLSQALWGVQNDLQIAASQYNAPLRTDFTTVFSEKAFDVVAFAPPDAQQPSPLQAALGKTLFYDNVLAGTGDRNCATCHQDGRAFTDGLPLPISTDGNNQGMRNTPTILNAALQRTASYDAGTFNLEERVEMVMNSKKELQTSPKEVGAKLLSIPEYVALFEKAFGKKAKTDVEMGRQAVVAISEYMRTQVSLNSPFDRYMRKENNDLSEAAKRGFNLFMGKAKCGTCHFAPLFNGTVPPAYADAETEVLGVPVKPLTAHAILDADQGKFNLFGMEVHKFAFKTPTVRNAALTAPYMHNGAYQTLDQVLDFYNRGGGAGIGIRLDNQTLPPDPLNLTEPDLADLKAFMESLNDTSPISSPPAVFPPIPATSKAFRKASIQSHAIK